MGFRASSTAVVATAVVVASPFVIQALIERHQRRPKAKGEASEDPEILETPTTTSALGLTTTGALGLLKNQLMKAAEKLVGVTTGSLSQCSDAAEEGAVAERLLAETLAAELLEAAVLSEVAVTSAIEKALAVEAACKAIPMEAPKKMAEEVAPAAPSPPARPSFASAMDEAITPVLKRASDSWNNLLNANRSPSSTASSGRKPGRKLNFLDNVNEVSGVAPPGRLTSPPRHA